MKGESAWPLLTKMLWSQRFRMTAALVFSSVAAAAELLPFWIVFLAIDTLLQSSWQATDAFLPLAGWLLLSLVLKSILYTLAYFFSHQAAYNLLIDTRRKMISKLACAPLEWLQRHASGKLKHALLQDVENIENFIAHHTVEVLAAVVTPLLVATWLCFTDWRLALAALLVAPVAVLSCWLFMRNTSEHYLEYNQSAAKLDATTVEYLRNMPVMKLLGQDTTRFFMMRTNLAHYYAVVNKITHKTVPGWSLFNTLLGANILLILPVGIVLFDRGEVALPQIVLALLLGAGMLKPLVKISRFFMEINDVLAAAKQITPIFRLSATPERAAQVINTPLHIQFDKVSFAYQDKVIVSDLSFDLPAGSFTVVIGPSGSGKTTLVQLLAGLLIPQSGDISIAGIPVASLNHHQRSTLLAMASQDAFLFKGSIRENVLLGRENATDTEIEKALEVAQAEAFICSLPQGLDTQINEQGIGLSGGERQRIAMARAFLADTPIVILDEASASLDNLTQQALYRAINRHYPDKTLIVITHRNDGLDLADHIILLEQGRVSAAGNHQQLLGSSAFYQQLSAYQRKNEHWHLKEKTNHTKDVDLS